MSLNDTSTNLFKLFTAMDKRYHTNPNGTMGGNEALNAFNIIKNEQPDLINVLPEDIKKKLSNGLTQDLFSSADPLGVADGLINQEEFAKGLESGTAEEDPNITLGNHGRGTDPNHLNYVQSYDRAGYSTPGANGKRDAVQASNNIIIDFEGAMQGQPGSTSDKQLSKGELGVLISKWNDAGLLEKKKVAQDLYDHYDQVKNANGIMDVQSLANNLKQSCTDWQ